MRKFLISRDCLKACRSPFFVGIYFAISSLIFTSSSVFAQNWTTQSNTVHARSEATAVSYGDDIYVFNGFGPDIDIEASVEKYDASSKRWIELGSTSIQQGTATTHAGVVLVGDDVWHIGGRIGDNPGPVTDKVWIYSIPTGRWRQGPTLPDPFAGGGAALVNNRVHVFGGVDDRARCDVPTHLVYDLANTRAGWTKLGTQADMPDARNHFSTVVLDKNIYAIGGQFGHDSCNGQRNRDTDLVDRYDPATNKWERLSNLPAVQSHAEPSTFAYAGSIYMVGGEISGNKVLRYDPTKDKWTTIMTLPRALLAPVSRIIDGQLIVGGGGAPTTRFPIRTVYSSDIDVPDASSQEPTDTTTPDNSNETPATETNPTANVDTASNTVVTADSNALLVVEAESFDQRTATAIHQWIVKADADAEGELAMLTTPDSGALLNGSSGSPMLSYLMYFDNPGKYYLWVRGKGDTNLNGQADSLHAGLNGELLATATIIENFPNRWSWSSMRRGGQRVVLSVPSAGVHAINLWMREDGLLVDKLVLTTDSQYIPVDSGPVTTQGNTGPVVVDDPSETANMPVVSTAIDASAAWESLQSSDGSSVQARHEAGGVAVNGKLYVLGGRGSRLVQSYDPATGRWTSHGTTPVQMHHFQPVAVNGKIYVIGAFGDGSYPLELPMEHIYVFDTATHQWSKGPSVPPDRQRGSAGAAVYQGSIYIIGGNRAGHSGPAVKWFDEFDPQTGKWTQLPDAPHARDHITVGVVNNRLVVTAGRSSQQPNVFDNTVSETDVYNFTRGRWETSAEDIPTPRAGTMTVVVDNEVVVIGGESLASSAAHRTVESFDVQTGGWRELQSLLTGRHSGGAAVVDGNIHVVSGNGRRGGGNELDSHEILQLQQNASTDNYVALVSEPVTPLAIYPAAGDTVVENEAVVIRFGPVANATRYHVQRYDGAIRKTSFSDNGILPNACSGASCTVLVPSIAAQDRASWRVRALNVAGWSDWSRWVEFTVLEAVTTPATPIAIYPAAGDSVVENKAVVIRFGQVANATRYHVQRYDRAIRKTSFSDNRILPNSCSGASCTVSVPGISAQDRASWRVRALNVAGWSDWSRWIDFAVESGE